jgi:uncharacterized protein YqjF (DUF2071 family)
MFQNWDQLTFLHWRCDPAAIRPFLVPGLEIDTFDNSAWIGMTPFVLRNLRPPFLPAVPWLSHFPETNLRTYARGPGNYPGIWFFSLEAARLAAVIGARATYGLPYQWAKMQVTRERRVIHYSSRRRWPGPLPATTAASIEIGERFAPHELGDLDHFLTARYRLFSQMAGRLCFAQVEHAPWPLTKAEVISLTESLRGAAGLPVSKEEPLVHFSPELAVRIGPPQYALKVASR